MICSLSRDWSQSYYPPTFSQRSSASLLRTIQHPNLAERERSGQKVRPAVLVGDGDRILSWFSESLCPRCALCVLSPRFDLGVGEKSHHIGVFHRRRFSTQKSHFRFRKWLCESKTDSAYFRTSFRRSPSMPSITMPRRIEDAPASGTTLCGTSIGPSDCDILPPVPRS